MKIIQTRFLKNILTSVGLVLIFFNISGAQSRPIELNHGDSLFQARQYTQSFELYSILLKEKQQHSPAMLLKMAYIQEGLGHISMSLYYLNLYFMASHDEQALAKMEEIASKNRLEGYQPSDVSRVLTKLQQYSFHITSLLLSVSVCLFALIFYQKVRQHKKPLTPAFILVFFLALLFAYTHFSEYIKLGIVSEPFTYLMSGPSAGSSVIDVIDEGHQLKILGKTDVWIKVKWKDKEVFIKESSLLPVRL